MINLVASRKVVASILAAVWLALSGQGISYGQSSVEEGKIYWTDSRDGIHRFSLDSKNVERLISPDLRRPGKIALDRLEGKIYWMDSRTIKRSDSDGENLEDRPFYPVTPDSLDFDIIWEIIDPPDGMAGIVQDIASELAESKIYWTTLYSHGDYFTAAVLRSNLDGSNIEYVATANRPRGIALDVTGGKVYWVDHSGSIARAELYGATIESVLNGSNVEYVLTGLDANLADIALDVVGGKMYWASYTDLGTGAIQRADYPKHIALDVVRGKIYWTLLGGHVIQRADLDGTNIEDVLTGLYSNQGIALDLLGNKIYWTEVNQIRCSNLDGTNIEDIVTDTDVENLRVEGGCQMATGLSLWTWSETKYTG